MGGEENERVGKDEGQDVFKISKVMLDPDFLTRWSLGGVLD
jgi:hypothetical protein